MVLGLPLDDRWFMLCSNGNLPLFFSASFRPQVAFRWRKKRNWSALASCRFGRSAGSERVGPSGSAGLRSQLFSSTTAPQHMQVMVTFLRRRSL